MLFGQNRHAIRADFVGHIAVGGNAVGPDNDQIHSALLHEITCHAIRNQRHRNRIALQFPSGEPRALEKRPGLIRQHLYLAPGKMRRPNHPQRCAVARRGQGAGIAVRQNGRLMRHQVEAVRPDLAVQADILFVQAMGLLPQRLLPLRQWRLAAALQALAHAVDGPEQIHRCGPGLRHGLTNHLKLRIKVGLGLDVLHPQRNARRRRDPDGRRPSHHHIGNRVGGFLISAALKIFFHHRQFALIE